jgi:type II secretory pathway predicted ATPase ExeA
MAKAETERVVAEHAGAPSYGVVVRAAQEYMAKAGMESPDLACEVGYAKSTIRHFFFGTYRHVASTDLYVRCALWDYLQEHPLPGEDARLPAKLLPTRDTRLILERVGQAREHARIIVIEGPPGTSKTTALRWASAERHRSGFKDTFYVRARTSMTGFALARRLASLLGANPNATRDRLISNVVRKLQQIPQAVLLIDEAQNLLDGHAEAFEQLRDVIDESACGCVLAGHWNFIRHLTNGMGRFLEQWLSRIDVRDHLRGLAEAELDEIAEQRLGQKLLPDIRRALISFATARDRNALYRNQILPQRVAPFATKFLSIRRVQKFFERIDDLRAIPGNEANPLAQVARAAIEKLMSPEERAL